MYLNKYLYGRLCTADGLGTGSPPPQHAIICSVYDLTFEY